MARRRVSQKALGDVLGLSQPPMSKRMNGTQPFTVTELDRLAAYFDVPITDLFGARGKEVRPDNVGYPPVDNQLALFVAAA